MMYMLSYKNTFRKPAKEHLTRRVIAFLKRETTPARKQNAQR